MVEVPDASFERVRIGGAEITNELHNPAYASRDLRSTDPEGNRWSSGTYRGEPRNS